MPWYRIHAMCGPGHQSNFETYYHSAKPLTKDEKADLWEDTMRSNDVHNAAGEVDVVRKLPKKVREEKVRKYEFQLQHAKKMLEILG